MYKKISVIIPSYKPDYTLYECLDSLEKQTFPKDLFEVIIILNGEKEPFFSEIMKYLESSTINANVFYESQAGVSRARNVGLRHCKGEYVTFIDADDFVSENYLQSLLETTVENGCLALANVVCYSNGHTSKDYLGKLFAHLCTEKDYGHIKTRSYFSVPIGKILPIGTVQNHSFDENLFKGEDGLFMFEIEPALPRCIKASDTTIYYRRLTEHSLSRKKCSRKENFRLNFRRLKIYSKIYFNNFTRYNMIFFLTRILAVLKAMLFNR